MKELNREEKQKNEDGGKKDRVAQCVSTPVPLSLRARDVSLSAEQNTGVFSRRSTRYTVGICWFEKKKRQKLHCPS